MEKWKKNTHSGQNSRGCTGTVSVLFLFSVLTSVRILAIAWSLIIRFE